MNTLNRKYTSSFFVNQQDYYTFIERWKEYANSSDGKTLTSTDYLYYLILRGKNYKKAFYPGRRMQNYDYPEGLYKARLSAPHIINSLGHGLLQQNWLNNVKKIIPSCYDENNYTADAYINESVEKLIEKPLITDKKVVFDQVKTMVV